MTEKETTKKEPKITFEKFDALNLKGFAERLTKAINSFYPFHDGAYVLSLNASYGCGKTTFLKMWQAYLEEKEHKVIYINAWETDFDNEPLIPIANALMAELDNSKAGKKAKQALLGLVGADALDAIANSAVKAGTGGIIDFKGILRTIKESCEEGSLEKIGEEISKGFSLKKDLYSKLNTALSEYVDTPDKKPLIILIDELDRVRPNYAVEFLEAIKHIFSVQGVCFVLAVDREQLEASVKQLYGDVDFNGYYRRFYTREVDLPKPEIGNLDKFVKQLMAEFFDRKTSKNIKFVFDDKQRPMIKEHTKLIIDLFKFSLRDAEHLFRIYAQFLVVDDCTKNYRSSWLEASLILIAFSVSKHKDIYHKLGNESFSPNDLLLFLEDKNVINDKKLKTQYSNLVPHMLAFMLSGNNELFKDQTFEVMIELGYCNKESNKEDVIDNICKVYSDFRHFNDISGFRGFYNKLESWNDFLG